MKSTAIANSNIALVKYWGKRNDTFNVPATPSLSLTLDGLTTTTTVTRLPGNKSDSFSINGKRLQG